MRFLCVHNHYQIQGGEDHVFFDEASLLESNGHEVFRYAVHNDTVADYSTLGLARRTLWSSETYKKIFDIVRDNQIDIAHFHNTLPLVSPSAYYAANKAGAKVVQTLHNYRYACPGMLFFRDGQPCEDCLGKFFPGPAIKHKCYRDSTAASTAVATMTTAHKIMGTWKSKIDRYIVMTAFGKKKSIEAGLPAEKLSLKPHFVLNDIGAGTGEGNYALYVGRLSKEKGIMTLIEAWLQHKPELPLKIIGDGPLRAEAEAAALNSAAISFEGPQAPESVSLYMGNARVVVVPSECYETFGRVVIEAYAAGTPVIVSNIGAIAELVPDDSTGILFSPGNSQELANAVNHLAARDPKDLRTAARSRYENKYSAEANYRMMMEIYQSVLES